MTEKRFTCHQMIADYSTGEDIDFDFLQELIDEQEQPKDLRMHICDGNKIITYRECVDLLNELAEENEQLKQSIKEVVELLSEEVNLFSDKSTEHDINAYMELKELDNKDAFYMATATKKAIKILKELQE